MQDKSDLTWEFLGSTINICPILFQLSTIKNMCDPDKVSSHYIINVVNKARHLGNDEKHERYSRHVKDIHQMCILPYVNPEKMYP